MQRQKPITQQEESLKKDILNSLSNFTKNFFVEANTEKNKPKNRESLVLVKIDCNEDATNIQNIKTFIKTLNNNELPLYYSDIFQSNLLIPKIAKKLIDSNDTDLATLKDSVSELILKLGLYKPNLPKSDVNGISYGDNFLLELNVIQANILSSEADMFKSRQVEMETVMQKATEILQKHIYKQNDVIDNNRIQAENKINTLLQTKATQEELIKKLEAKLVNEDLVANNITALENEFSHMGLNLDYKILQTNRKVTTVNKDLQDYKIILEKQTEDNKKELQTKASVEDLKKLETQLTLKQTIIDLQHKTLNENIDSYITQNTTEVLRIKEEQLVVLKDLEKLKKQTNTINNQKDLDSLNSKITQYNNQLLSLEQKSQDFINQQTQKNKDLEKQIQANNKLIQETAAANTTANKALAQELATKLQENQTKLQNDIVNLTEAKKQEVLKQFKIEQTKFQQELTKELDEKASKESLEKLETNMTKNMQQLNTKIQNEISTLKSKQTQLEQGLENNINQLQKNKQELEQQIKTANTKNQAQLTALNNQLTVGITRLQQQQESLKDANLADKNKLTQDINNQANELSKVQNQIKQAATKNDITTQQALINALKSQVNTIESTTSQLETKVMYAVDRKIENAKTNLEKQINNTQVQLKVRIESLDEETKLKLQTLEKNLQKEIKNCATAKDLKELQDKTESYKNLQNQINDNFSDKIDQFNKHFEEKINTLESHGVKMNKQVKKLTIKAKDTDKEIILINQKAKKIDQKIENISTNLKKTNTNVQQFNAVSNIKFTGVNQELQTLNNNNKNTERKVIQFGKKLAQVEENLKKTEVDLNQKIEKNLQKLKAVHGSLSSKIENVNKENKDALQAAQNAFDVKVDNLEKQQDLLKDLNEKDKIEFLTKINSQTENLGKFESYITEYIDKGLSNQENAINTLNKNINNIFTENEEFQQDINSKLETGLQKVRDDVRLDLDNLNAEFDKKLSENNQVNQENFKQTKEYINNIQTNLENASKEQLEEMKTIIAEVQSNQDGAIESFANKISNINSKLTNKIQETDAKVEQQSKQIEVLKNDHENFKEDVNQNFNNVQILMNEQEQALIKHTEDLDNLRSEIEQKETENNQKIYVLEELQSNQAQEIDNVKNDLQTKQEEINSINNEIETAKGNDILMLKVGAKKLELELEQAKLQAKIQANNTIEKQIELLKLQQEQEKFKQEQIIAEKQAKLDEEKKKLLEEKELANQEETLNLLFKGSGAVATSSGKSMDRLEFANKVELSKQIFQGKASKNHEITNSETTFSPFRYATEILNKVAKTIYGVKGTIKTQFIDSKEGYDAFLKNLEANIMKKSVSKEGFYMFTSSMPENVLKNISQAISVQNNLGILNKDDNSIENVTTKFIQNFYEKAKTKQEELSKKFVKDRKTSGAMTAFDYLLDTANIFKQRSDCEINSNFSEKIKSKLTESGRSSFILTAPAGAGKTTTIEVIASKIGNKKLINVPFEKLGSLTGSLVGNDAKTAEEFKAACQYYRDIGSDVCIVIDEVHNLFIRGDNNTMKGFNEALKTGLECGNAEPSIQILGITTDKEYDIYVQPEMQTNPALERRWTRYEMPLLPYDAVYNFVKKELSKNVMMSKEDIEHLTKFIIASCEVLRSDARPNAEKLALSKMLTSYKERFSDDKSTSVLGKFKKYNDRLSELEKQDDAASNDSKKEYNKKLKSLIEENKSYTMNFNTMRELFLNSLYKSTQSIQFPSKQLNEILQSGKSIDEILVAINIKFDDENDIETNVNNMKSGLNDLQKKVGVNDQEKNLHTESIINQTKTTIPTIQKSNQLDIVEELKEDSSYEEENDNLKSHTEQKSTRRLKIKGQQNTSKLDTNLFKKSFEKIADAITSLAENQMQFQRGLQSQLNAPQINTENLRNVEVRVSESVSTSHQKQNLPKKLVKKENITNNETKVDQKPKNEPKLSVEKNHKKLELGDAKQRYYHQLVEKIKKNPEQSKKETSLNKVDPYYPDQWQENLRKVENNINSINQSYNKRIKT